ncbi:putative carboxylesterase family protein [Rosellinia necatrix]|uniref:Putative carboxylesterase family protein n=1 Tax=Rosellinia necatrix TaxID=77044 RepID=A0A1W2TRA8_ROSNE|nr:putative carboxylesterase family protein [Rosellinia necatrix]
MSHKSPCRQDIEIHCDSPSEDNLFSRDRRAGTPLLHQPLRQLSIVQSQNRQPEQDCTGSRNHEPSQVSVSPNQGSTKENNTKEKRAGSRLTRPSITSDTFNVLDTVVEAESQTESGPAISTLPDHTQQILKLAVDQYSSHPLSIAACNIPPLEEQLAKHRNGQFEWILAVRVPNDRQSKHDFSSGVDISKETRKVYFGCNLLPKPSLDENQVLTATPQANNYLLLITSVEETKEVLQVFREVANDSHVTLLEANSGHRTPTKMSGYSSLSDVDEETPHSTACTRGDDSAVESIVESTTESASESISSRSLGDPVTRIEDSFEALDILEEQLEAFDKVARFGRLMPPESGSSTKESTLKPEPSTPNLSVRFATPQPQCTFTKPGPASLRAKPVSEPRKTTLRKMTSMTLDPYKSKMEEKIMIQSPPKPSNRGATGLSPQVQAAAKSTQQRMTPTFDLSGEAMAQHLKERKEARMVLHRATQPTASSLRRSKSAKLLTRPVFELPGEAISRRKREEHQAQLKAQEEEDRKRREFKARPPPPHAAPSTAPRETIASRARQNRMALAENTTQTAAAAVAAVAATSRRPYATIGPHARPVLSATINQPQPRGRGLRAEGSSGGGGGATLQPSRATSTSTAASASGKRSPLSVEDVQMQKLRGHEIYQRDNSWTDSRMREKSEREALAKLAREGAAEKSRQKSREWAAKQARKRMTVGSLRDVMA